jgi:hypothetical protein
MRLWKVMLGLLAAGTVAGVLAGGAIHPVMKPQPKPEWRDRIEKRYVPAANTEHLIIPAPRDLDPPQARWEDIVAADYPNAYPLPYEPLDLPRRQFDSPAPYPEEAIDADSEWASGEPEVSDAAIAAARAAVEVRHALADGAALAEEPSPPTPDTPPSDEDPPLL